MIRSSLLVALVATGCFFKPDAPGAGGSGDAGADAPFAKTFGPFGIAQPVPGIASTIHGDFNAAISKFDDELYFSTERETPGVRLYRATRMGNGPFDQLVRVEPAGLEAEYEAAITLSGLELYFYDGSYNLSKRTRTSFGSEWMTAVPDLPAGLGPFDFCCDDQRLIGGTTPNPINKMSKLIEYVRNGASWALADDPNIGPGTDGVVDPSLSRDGLEMFYEVHTAGPGQIWHTTRTSLTAPFAQPEQLVIMGLLPNADYGDPELTVDGTRLYFSLGVAADYEQYFIERQPLD